MKLKELVNKIDNDIVLWIVRAPDTNVLFKRKHPFDVIPIEIEIEPCEEEDTQEGRNERGN